MEQLLYSASIIKFYEHFSDDAGTAAECAERVGRAISVVADELKLGKYAITLNAPANQYDAQGVSIKTELYEYKGGFEDEAIIYEYTTGEHGKVYLHAYPRKNCTWNEQEKKALSTFSMNVYILFGRSRLNELMKKSIVTDNVAGIDNITGFTRYASEVSYRVGLEKYHAIRFNIKNFSILNKNFFRNKSNDVIRTYSCKIKDFIQDRGTVARLGGDNFIALVENEFLNEFVNFVTAVPIKIDSINREVKIGARLGICAIRHKDSIGDVMDHLDVVINIAKDEGRNIVYFEPAMIEKANKEKAIVAMLPEALANKEFQIYFQPKIDLLNNKLCGCEALVRWGKDGQIIPPMDFVPVLEDEGIVCELDFYVFEECCKIIRSWMDKGCEPGNVSINFSKLHLRNPDTAEKIFDIIEKYQIDESLIEIELTELSGYDNFESLVELVDKLKERGIRSSIDDFGTGYSSLNLLKSLNVDVVKIDKSFLDSLSDSKVKSRILLKNIVDMIHDMEYKVIAEGVETKEQADFLKEIGCTMAQGYLFDKPLPEYEFEKRLVNGISYN